MKRALCMPRRTHLSQSYSGKDSSLAVTWYPEDLTSWPHRLKAPDQKEHTVLWRDLISSPYA